MRRLLILFGVVFAASVWAEETPAPQPSPAPDRDETVKREELVVVTASKVESTLVNAPATMSVVTPETIAASPAQNYGDLLRSVPGLNVIQMSARDVNLTSRQNTATLSNSQLALLDGRSIYLDFFGLILWDMAPTQFSEIKQIEVVRGPASAVWGANALTGVVNIITKSPRESTGGTVSLSGGFFSRDAGDTAGKGSGTIFGSSARYAAAPNDRWSYKLSAGYFNSDAYPRPTGKIPVTTHPLDSTISVGGGLFQDTNFRYVNQGTSQPKFDARVDQDLGGGRGRLTYSAGVAGTDGIVHAGIGPFDLQNGSVLGYGRVGYNKGSFKLAAFANILDAQAPNLVSRDATGKLLELDFTTQTYDIEVGHSRVITTKQLLSYGANVRRNNFDISLAPRAENRTELGAYLQDELFFEKFRLTVGGRVDKFGNLDDPVFSPRVTAMYKPLPAHSIRVSFNKAFRSPSVINNYLDIKSIVGTFPLGLLNPALAGAQFPIIARSVGSKVAQTMNPAFKSLKEESLTAYEVAYTGTFNKRTTVGIAAYINDVDDNINFVTTPSQIALAGLPAVYTSANPPPGWPLSPALIDVLRGQGIALPATLAYLNLGPIRNRGIELSLQHVFKPWATGYANYSWQDAPEVLDPEGNQSRYPTAELSVAPKNRLNAGIDVSHERYLGSVSVNYSDKAFWQDVLTAAFNGFTKDYTMLNASFGVKWNRGKVTTLVKGTNLTNQKIQQHIFGDIITRSIMGEVRLDF